MYSGFDDFLGFDLSLLTHSGSYGYALYARETSWSVYTPKI